MKHEAGAITNKGMRSSDEIDERNTSNASTAIPKEVIPKIDTCPEEYCDFKAPHTLNEPKNTYGDSA
jgi:hypothetical protein